MSEAVRPADGYFAMQDILPTSYFLEPPPPCGTRFSVYGVDGVMTTWDVGTFLGAQIERQLKRRQDVKFTSRPYDGFREQMP